MRRVEARCVSKRVVPIRKVEPGPNPTPSPAVPTSEHEIRTELIRRLRKVPSRRWVEEWFGLAKELIDKLHLETSNPRRVVSMPRGELGLHVTVGHRDVLTAFCICRGGSASQDTSPTWDASSPVLVSDLVSDPTKRVFPWWASFATESPRSLFKPRRTVWLGGLSGGMGTVRPVAVCPVAPAPCSTRDHQSALSTGAARRRVADDQRRIDGELVLKVGRGLPRMMVFPGSSRWKSRRIGAPSPVALGTSCCSFYRTPAMSIDKSLRKGGGLGGQRNVLKRAERMALLQEDGRWTENHGPYNLPKTKYRKLKPGQSGPKRPESAS